MSLFWFDVFDSGVFRGVFWFEFWISGNILFTFCDTMRVYLSMTVLICRMLAVVRICRVFDCETRSTSLYMKLMSFCIDCIDIIDGISMSL